MGLVYNHRTNKRLCRHYLFIASVLDPDSFAVACASSLVVIFPADSRCFGRPFQILANLLLLIACLHCFLRDLVSSQRAVSASTTPSRNFFSTFLPQGRRTPGKPPQVTMGASPTQVAAIRKEPPIISQVKASNSVRRETIEDRVKCSSVL